VSLAYVYTLLLSSLLLYTSMITSYTTNTHHARWHTCETFMW